MFCPKCGTKNPDDGKFCRSCGADLSAVELALSGKLAKKTGNASVSCSTDETSRDPDDVYASGIRSAISGLGFAVVSIVLLVSNVANGHRWWWALLFPAFFMLAHGISDIVKSKRLAASGNMARASFAPMPAQMDSARTSHDLPPATTDFVPAESRFRTGDLVPPSVVDNTTRNLEINSDGETMALPKK